jgi:hypothetical protein
MHSSFTMVDVVITAADARQRMAEAMRRFAGTAARQELPRAAE